MPTICNNKYINSTDKVKCMEIYLNIFNEISYGCLFCKKEIHYLHINKHIKEHFNVISCKCYICENVCTDFKQLINHINCHQNKNDYKENININGNRYKNKKNKPIAATTTTTTNYLCLYCGKEFINPHERLQHLMDHLEMNTIEFVESNIKTYSSNFVTENQLIIKNVDDSSSVEKCNEYTILYIEDNNQLDAIDLDSNGSETNAQIDKFTTNNNNNNNTVETTITDIKARKKKPSRLRKRYHHNNSLYVCDVCGNKYTKKGYFNVHSKTHQGIKFECKICHKQCTQAAGLKKHMRVHTDERPYACKLCGQTFRFSSNYTRHVQRHENIYRYECTYCGKKFLVNDYLKAHLRIHTGEKPYMCGICNAAFADSGTLKSHKRLHSDIKQYLCKDCGKCFAQRSGLYSHKKVHKKHIMLPPPS